MFGYFLVIKHFCDFLYGTQFTFLINHLSLHWLQEMKDPNGFLAPWDLKLQYHDFSIVHKSRDIQQSDDSLSCLVSISYLAPKEDHITI